MIKNLIYSRIPIILIMGFIVITTTNCINNDSYDPHQDEPWWTSSTVKDHRLENLLKELLIEMQETNATLKRIEDRLDR